MANLGFTNRVYGGDLDAASGGGVSPQQLYSYLRGIGANGNEALFVTGAGASESDLNPNAVHDNGVGYGMFGHNGSRLLAMKDYAQRTGGNLSDWRTQAAFTLQELRNRPEGKAVANATSPDQLAQAQMYFERPAGFTTADPTAGLNYLGRLNTLRRFTGLDPNATGNFAAGANPQVTPAQFQGAGLSTNGAGASASAAPGSPGVPTSARSPATQSTDAMANSIYNSFVTPGDTTARIPASVNLALARALAQQPQSQTGAALNAGQQAPPGLLGGLVSALIGGGGQQGGQASNAAPGATSSPPAAVASPPAAINQPSSDPSTADVPLPPPRPADLTSSSTGAPASSSPYGILSPFNAQAPQPPIFSSLSNLFGTS